MTADLPPHLRDNAPQARCGRCGRVTVDEASFGREDRMTQPDGFPCGGRFSHPEGDVVVVPSPVVVFERRAQWLRENLGYWAPEDFDKRFTLWKSGTVEEIGDALIEGTP